MSRVRAAAESASAPRRRARVAATPGLHVSGPLQASPDGRTGFVSIDQIRGAKAPDVSASRNGVTAKGGQAPAFDVEMRPSPFQWSR